MEYRAEPLEVFPPVRSQGHQSSVYDIPMPHLRAWYGDCQSLPLEVQMANRDDFSPDTKRRLAHRAGYVCSFPGCPIHTAGPSDDALDAINNVGVAAHITAAAPGGPRFDAAMTPEQRSAFSNGIWLCETHAKLIDGDVTKWSVTVLQGMKADAEKAASARLEGAGRSPNDLSVDVAACVYMKSYRAAYVPAMIVNEGPTPVTIKSVQLRLGAEVFAPNKARTHVTLEGCDWFTPGPLRLQSADAIFGAWYFGWSFEGGGRHVETSAGATAELVLSPVGKPDIVLRLDLIHPDDPASSGVAAVRQPNGPQALQRDHDLALFRRIDAALPEVRLVAIADRLQTSDDYMRSDLSLLQGILDLAKLESNRFCDEVLNAHFLDLAQRLKDLLDFTSKRFFRYPAEQNFGDDTQYVLAPDLNEERGGRVSEESGTAYSELQETLDALVTAVRGSYRAFRAGIRASLAE